jgi:hypothetical protein
MGRPHIAKGPAMDDNPQAWAHCVSIKRVSPAPVIKFICGQGHQIKAFLLPWNVDLKNCGFKWLIGKTLIRSAAHIKGPRHTLIGFFDTLFSLQMKRDFGVVHANL